MGRRRASPAPTSLSLCQSPVTIIEFVITFGVSTSFAGDEEKVIKLRKHSKT